MKARVIRRGGEVAVVIPNDIAARNLRAVDEVDVEVRGTEVVISQIEMTLDEMIDQITDENRHEETDWGAPVGNEVW